MSQRQRSKQLYTLILLLGFVYISQAQDWAPIRVGEKYHYDQGNFSFLAINFPLLPTTNNGVVNDFDYGVSAIVDSTFSIAVDSALNISGDIYYKYVNRVEPCDTCSNFFVREIEPIDSSYFYPQIIQKSTGGYYLIFVSDTIELADNIITTSIINPVQQFHTYIDSIHLGTWLLGSCQDSIASITVRSTIAPFPILYTIDLSKQHGLVRAFRYDIATQNPELLFEMIGKEGLVQSGYKSLGFQDIYNFNVGNQFYYYNYIFDGTGWTYPTNELEFWYRIKIVNRVDVSLDSIIYTVEKVFYQQGYPVLSNLNVPDTFDITYVHSENNLYTMQQSEIRNINGWSSEAVICKDLFIWGNLKYIGYDFGLTALQTGIPWWQQDNYISLFTNWGTGSSGYEGILDESSDMALLYGYGLGLVYDGQWRFEHTDITELRGFIKGTTVVGQTPNIILLNQSNLEKADNTTIKIIENPARHHLHIYYDSEKTGTELNFSVIDMQGRVLQNYITADVSDKTYIVPVYDLTTGIYVLEIRRDGQLLKSEQFIKN